MGDDDSDLVQPQRDFNSMSGPNPPVDRAAKLRTHASHAGGQLIEHKMAVVRQRIKDMQHANPKLRFQAAWDSLRATHPDLFDEESGRASESQESQASGLPPPWSANTCPCVFKPALSLSIFGCFKGAR